MSALALLFPGQGAQAVGMGRAYYDRSDTAREIFKRATSRLGFDVAALCFEGPPEELAKTERCQPALFVTAFAAFAAFCEHRGSVRPVGAAGLSLGELTALAAAEAFTFAEALEIVRARGELMAECAARQGGAMLAVIGLQPELVEEVCRASGAGAANYNAPDQIVLSGPVEAIEQAAALAKARGATRALKLDVTGAFHSPLMAPAAEQFRKVLAKVEPRAPRWPVISNVTGRPVQDPSAIRKLLVEQIVSPVRWEPSMRSLIQDGATHFAEFPPARVLTGLLRRIDRRVTGVVLDAPERFEQLSDVP